MNNRRSRFGLGQRNKKWITAFLLLLLTISAAAQDDIIQRGCRVGTPRTEGMVLRRGVSEGQPKQVGGDFYVGNRRQLVVLVSFSDQDFSDSDPVSAWTRVFNEPNFTQGDFHGSVHDYFLEQSDGSFSLMFDIEYIAFSHSRVKYRSTSKDDENSQYLVSDVVDTLLTRDIRWSRYDWNADGFINQLMIVYAGKGQNDGGDSNTIWPHQWWMSEHLKDLQPGVYCEPIPVTDDGRQYLVDCYCALQEIAKGKKYGSFGTIIHEYTHCFGLPDFYHGTLSPEAWDLMANGNNNGSGFCPPNYSGHERMIMGWSQPVVLSTSQTVTDMSPSQYYIIYNDAYPNEYYMVENRQQTGWDSYLPGKGLVVFHVDYSEYAWLYEYPNSGTEPRYTIFAANYKNDKYSVSSGWAYPYVVQAAQFINNDSLTNNSVPAAILYHINNYGTKLMSKSLRDIQVTNGLASFRFTLDHPTGIIEHRTSQSYTILYDLGPIYIIRYSNGEIKKVMKRP